MKNTTRTVISLLIIPASIGAVLIGGIYTRSSVEHKHATDSETPPPMLGDCLRLFQQAGLVIINDVEDNNLWQYAKRLAEEVRSITGGEIAIRAADQVSEEDRTKNNIILLGVSNSIPFRAKVDLKTALESLSEDDPSQPRGILDVASNPWNREKALLLIAGNNAKALKAAIEEFSWLLTTASIIAKTTGPVEQYDGVLQMVSFAGDLHKLKPDVLLFYLESESGKVHFLQNIHAWASLLPGEAALRTRVVVDGGRGEMSLPVGRRVRVEGVARMIEKTSDPGEYVNGIVVSRLWVIEQ